MTNHRCKTCGIIVCGVCRDHRFPANEKMIADSDRLHGVKKQPCTCAKERKTRRNDSFYQRKRR
jgi:hypothetical protein